MQKKLKKIAIITIAMLRENRGLIAGLVGEISSDLRGVCSGLRGVCSGLRGDCSGLRGEIDECKISDVERKAGLNISDLIDV